MSETHFHSLLRQRILEEMERRGQPIIRGGCSDHAHYQYQCGTIVGLEVALKLADELEKEYD